MKHEIAVIPGDGVGPEITDEAVKVLKAVGDVSGRTFQFKQFLAGGIAIDEFGVPMPEATVRAFTPQTGKTGWHRCDGCPGAMRGALFR